MSTRSVLKAFFETGDKPTQAEFADFIDSDYNLDDDTTDEISEGTSNFFLTILAQVITGIKTFTNGLVYNARTVSGINSVSYSLSVSIDLSLMDLHEIGSVTGNLTINASNVSNGQTGSIYFPIDSTGGYTIALGSGTWIALGGSDISTANEADKEYFITFIVRNSTIYYNIISTS